MTRKEWEAMKADIAAKHPKKWAENKDKWWKNFEKRQAKKVQKMEMKKEWKTLKAEWAAEHTKIGEHA